MGSRISAEFTIVFSVTSYRVMVGRTHITHAPPLISSHEAHVSLTQQTSSRFENTGGTPVYLYCDEIWAETQYDGLSAGPPLAAVWKTADGRWPG